jgi:hypothetical protein
MQKAPWIFAALLGAAALAACDVDSSPPIAKVKGSERCASCHMDDYLAARGHEGERPTTCEICHTQAHWHDKHFDHPYELTGKHEKVDCFDCHTGTPPKFEHTSKTCVGCHRADYDKENEKNPKHRKHPTTCDDCHLTTGWADWDEKKAAADKPPPPQPTETAVATTIPTTAPTTAPTTRPRPRKPKPVPIPVPTPTPTPVPTRPDIVTRPSER